MLLQSLSTCLENAERVRKSMRRPIDGAPLPGSAGSGRGYNKVQQQTTLEALEAAEQNARRMVYFAGLSERISRLDTLVGSISSSCPRAAATGDEWQVRNASTAGDDRSCVQFGSDYEVNEAKRIVRWLKCAAVGFHSDAIAGKLCQVQQWVSSRANSHKESEDNLRGIENEVVDIECEYDEHCEATKNMIEQRKLGLARSHVTLQVRMQVGAQDWKAALAQERERSSQRALQARQSLEDALERTQQRKEKLGEEKERLQDGINAEGGQVDDGNEIRAIQRGAREQAVHFTGIIYSQQEEISKLKRQVIEAEAQSENLMADARGLTVLHDAALRGLSRGANVEGPIAKLRETALTKLQEVFLAEVGELEALESANSDLRGAVALAEARADNFERSIALHKEKIRCIQLEISEDDAACAMISDQLADLQPQLMDKCRRQMEGRVKRGQPKRARENPRTSTMSTTSCHLANNLVQSSHFMADRMQSILKAGSEIPTSEDKLRSLMHLVAEAEAMISNTFSPHGPRKQAHSRAMGALLAVASASNAPGSTQARDWLLGVLCGAPSSSSTCFDRVKLSLLRHSARCLLLVAAEKVGLVSNQTVDIFQKRGVEAECPSISSQERELLAIEIAMRRSAPLWDHGIFGEQWGAVDLALRGWERVHDVFAILECIDSQSRGLEPKVAEAVRYEVLDMLRIGSEMKPQSAVIVLALLGLDLLESQEFLASGQFGFDLSPLTRSLMTAIAFPDMMLKEASSTASSIVSSVMACWEALQLIRFSDNVTLECVEIVARSAKDLLHLVSSGAKLEELMACRRDAGSLWSRTVDDGRFPEIVKLLGFSAVTFCLTLGAESEDSTIPARGRRRTAKQVSATSTNSKTDQVAVAIDQDDRMSGRTRMKRCSEEAALGLTRILSLDSTRLCRYDTCVGDAWNVMVRQPCASPSEEARCLRNDANRLEEIFIQILELCKMPAGPEEAACSAAVLTLEECVKLASSLLQELLSLKVVMDGQSLGTVHDAQILVQGSSLTSFSQRGFVQLSPSKHEPTARTEKELLKAVTVLDVRIATATKELVALESNSTKIKEEEFQLQAVSQELMNLSKEIDESHALLLDPPEAVALRELKQLNAQLVHKKAHCTKMEEAIRALRHKCLDGTELAMLHMTEDQKVELKQRMKATTKRVKNLQRSLAGFREKWDTFCRDNNVNRGTRLLC